MSAVLNQIAKKEATQAQQAEVAKEQLERIIVAELNGTEIDLTVDEVLKVFETLNVDRKHVENEVWKRQQRRQLRANWLKRDEFVRQQREIENRKKARVDEFLAVQAQFEAEILQLEQESKAAYQLQQQCDRDGAELRRTAPKWVHDRMNELNSAKSDLENQSNRIYERKGYLESDLADAREKLKLTQQTRINNPMPAIEAERIVKELENHLKSLLDSEYRIRSQSASIRDELRELEAALTDAE